MPVFVPAHRGGLDAPIPGCARCCPGCRRPRRGLGLAGRRACLDAIFLRPGASLRGGPASRGGHRRRSRRAGAGAGDRPGDVRRDRARKRKVGDDPHPGRLVGDAHPAGFDRRDKGRDGRRGRRRRDDRSERRPGSERPVHPARDPPRRRRPGLRRPTHPAPATRGCGWGPGAHRRFRRPGPAGSPGEPFNVVAGHAGCLERGRRDSDGDGRPGRRARVGRAGSDPAGSGRSGSGRGGSGRADSRGSGSDRTGSRSGADRRHGFVAGRRSCARWGCVRAGSGCDPTGCGCVAAGCRRGQFESCRGAADELAHAHRHEAACGQRGGRPHASFPAEHHRSRRGLGRLERARAACAGGTADESETDRGRDFGSPGHGSGRDRARRLAACRVTACRVAACRVAACPVAACPVAARVYARHAGGRQSRLGETPDAPAAASGRAGAARRAGDRGGFAPSARGGGRSLRGCRPGGGRTS